MFSQQIGKHVQIVLAALATLAFTAGSSSAAPITLDFTELAGGAGIHLTGTDSSGTPIDVTKALAETFRVSAMGCACAADLTLSQIGTMTEFLVNIVESPGGRYIRPSLGSPLRRRGLPGHRFLVRFSARHPGSGSPRERSGGNGKSSICHELHECDRYSCHPNHSFPHRFRRPGACHACASRHRTRRSRLRAPQAVTLSRHHRPRSGGACCLRG